MFYSARVKITVCDASKVETLLKNVDQCGDLKYIIKIGDNVTDEEQERAKEHGVEIVTFNDIEVSRKYLIKMTFIVIYLMDLGLLGAGKLNYVAQFYLFATKYKTTTYNEKNEDYFLTLITAGCPPSAAR